MAKAILQRIRDWDQYYKENENEYMPWYSKFLDNDIKNELIQRNIKEGSFLDIGTGPGTQASALAELGFEVTGTDVAENAIMKLNSKNSKLRFIVDDILDSKLNEQFDYIIDRGCFHVFKPEQRPAFVQNVSKLLNTGGFYFMKCFCHKQKGDTGPQRISPEIVFENFEKDFIVHSIKESVFDGERSSMPKALFVVMEKK
jgi:2-polyprenyl-3-methyl-5-hydroxy-6-metoxy-1,4-benzoquinol methylase